VIVWVAPGTTPGLGLTNNLWRRMLLGRRARGAVAMNWGMRSCCAATEQRQGGPGRGARACLARLPLAVPRRSVEAIERVWPLVDASIGQQSGTRGCTGRTSTSYQ